MTHFIYTKYNGDTSERDVIPIGFYFGSREKVMCIETTNLSKDDLSELEAIRLRYLEDLYKNDFAPYIKTFFLDNMFEISE